MSEQQDPLEQLLDLLVYAPLGLVLSARDVLPTLAEKGRRHFAPQATAARLVGKLAVRQGQREAEHLVAKARRQAESLLGEFVPGARPRPGDTTTGPMAAEAEEGSNGSRPPAPPAAGPSGADQPAGVPDPAPVPSGLDVSELAIPGYDTLSASQVVQRLEGLTPEELDTVRAYEQGGRARKTVLSRIAQLRGSP